MYRVEQKLDLSEFTSALRTGGLKTVMVDVAANRFVIRAYTRQNNCLVTLVTKRNKGRWRFFNSPLEPLQMLRQMGAIKVEMHLSDWAPEKPKPYLRRKDQSERMRGLHQAAKRQAMLERVREEAEALSRIEAERKAPGLMVLEVLRRGLAANAFAGGQEVDG